MADSIPNSDTASEQVAVTIKVDAKVYEAFQRKAQQANMDVETLLGNTLTIVLGCRAFESLNVCKSKAPTPVE